MLRIYSTKVQLWKRYGVLRYGLLGLLLACLLLSGCAKEPQKDFSQVTSDFFGFGDQLADQLVVNKRHKGVKEERLILTTFVHLDDLYQTSSFGRAMTESLSSALFRRGFRVAEIRKGPGLYVKSKSGELTLTRDISLIAREQEVQAIVAGTYSLTPTTVVINARLLAAESEEVLSVAGLEIERSANINYLLSERKGPVVGPLSAYER
jgi:TolB-like protein